jgi:hypothetical protein
MALIAGTDRIAGLIIDTLVLVKNRLVITLVLGHFPDAGVEHIVRVQ